MSANFSNWIIIGPGDSINMDFVAKAMWGGDFKTPVPTRLYIFHGGVAGNTGAGITGSNTMYDYGDAIVAKAMRDKINALLVDGGATDLRAQPNAAANTVPPGTSPAVALSSYTASPIGSDSNASNANLNGSTVTIKGTGFTAAQSGKLISADGSINVPVTFLSSTTLQAALPAVAAGTVSFNYQYRAADGTLQTLTAALNITFS